jgi:hypothetical protein
VSRRLNEAEGFADNCDDLQGRSLRNLPPSDHGVAAGMRKFLPRISSLRRIKPLRAEQMVRCRTDFLNLK